MAQAALPLRIIAQPKTPFRERYANEMNPQQNRAQRFVRAESNPYKLAYPTVAIPCEWLDKREQLLYIRLTLVTVPNERVPFQCVHPYPINTEDANVYKDPLTNTLFFPISDDELRNGRKSFQFTLHKLTQYQLKEHGPLRILDSEDHDEHHLEDGTDVKKIIEIYQLGQSQLLFSIATFRNDTQSPVVYNVSTVLSHVMAGIMPSTNDDDISFRCSPQRGDCQGGDEILMVIPKVDKRKAFSVRFVHPLIDPQSTVDMEFVDAKTISFFTPRCPVVLTRENPTLSLPLVVIQNGIEIARVNFTYQSLNKCVACNSDLILTHTTSPTNHKRKLPDPLEEDDDEEELPDVSPYRTETHGKADQFFTENSILPAQLSLSVRSDEHLALLDHAIRRGSIDVALQLIRQTNNLLEQENNQGETPLLLAARLNRLTLIQTILEKRPDYAKQVDLHGNNLLHLLASVSGNNARQTIESVVTRLDRAMKEHLITQMNKNNEVPKQVARRHGNMQYLDLL